MTSHIDLPKILNIAHKGVRRAAVFMGLGLNAGINPEFNNYQLEKISFFRFIPDNIPEERIKEFKVCFCSWIICNGLRELLELHCVFLDKIHLACLIIKANKENMVKTELEKRDKNFQNFGLKEKHKKLFDEFGLVVENQEYLTTLYLARNCLTHRMGIVSSRDFNEIETLCIKWIGFEMWAQSANGDKQNFDLPIVEPVNVITDAGIYCRIIHKEKKFQNGDVIDFNGNELGEICYYAYWLAEKITGEATNYARNSGVVHIVE